MPAINILSDATNGLRDNIRRMRSGTLRQRPRAQGKENYPSFDITAYPTTNISPPSTQDTSDPNPHKWDPVDGKIIIKVSVPSTDDIWRFKVPEDVTLAAFREKVETKLGFPVRFCTGGGAVTHNGTISTEERFKKWVAGRVKDGRNTPLKAHRQRERARTLQSTPLSSLQPNNFPF